MFANEAERRVLEMLFSFYDSRLEFFLSLINEIIPDFVNRDIF